MFGNAQSAGNAIKYILNQVERVCMSELKAAVGHILFMQLIVAAVIVDNWANKEE